MLGHILISNEQDNQRYDDSANAKQKANLDIMIDTKDIKKQLMDALRKAFK